jgi:uncharacterized membrane protein YtjA (UPF0391 family)
MQDGPYSPPKLLKIKVVLAPNRKNEGEKGVNNMLGWTIFFLVVALIAGLLGFAGIAGAAAGIAKILFFLFLILFVLSLIFGRRRLV